MNEYQVSVSAGGKFLFRTEWDNDKGRVGALAITLRVAMPGARVEVYSKSKVMHLVTPESLI